MSFLRWALLVLLILGGMVAASLGGDGDGWRGTVQWVQRQRPMLERRLLPCPPLHDGAMPAGVAGDYAAVAPVAGRVGAVTDGGLLRDACEAEARVDGDSLQAALQRWSPACDQLRAAARGAARLGPGEFDSVQLMVTVDALLLTARRGAPSLAAAQDLLDVFHCGADLANSWRPLESLLGGLVVQRATEAVSDAVLRRFDASALQALVAGLATVDAVLHPESMMPLLQAGALVTQLDVEREVRPEELGLSTRWQAWRHGFSVRDSGRARTRALVASLQGFVRDPVAIEAWPARRAMLRELDLADRTANADLWHPLLAGAEQCEAARRTAVAQLRLLRLAVAFHAGTGLPNLADPLGDGALQVVEVDGGVLLRSVQPDVQRPCRRP